MVEEVNKWLWDLPAEKREEFLNTSEKDLILYHFTLGRKIRNHFYLWSYEWTPKIENGVDMSDDHPDSVSFQVIKEVWAKNRDLPNCPVCGIGREITEGWGAPKCSEKECDHEVIPY
jgi:hypothetical protein